jgi:CO/xanthine dehydrogenase FAD-binding subunit
MLVLNAELAIRGPKGDRVEPAATFFEDAYTTSLAPEEVLTEIRIPAISGRTGWGFHEVSRRHGDFAIVAAAALVTLDDAGAIHEARIGIAGAAPHAVRAPSAETALAGAQPEVERLREASALVRSHVDPHSDVAASADYRREISAVVARRALVDAVKRARGDAA